jgi:hypothetical protein
MAHDIWELLTEVQLAVNLGASMGEETDPSLVAVGDLKLVLMAIFGIKGNKRLGVVKPTALILNLGKEDTTTFQSDVDIKLPYGWLNDQN